MKVTKAGFMLDVADMSRAVAFYRDVIGLEAGMESPDWSELRFGDATVGLHGGRENADVVQTGLYFYVDDIAAACEEATAAGAKLVFGPNASPEEGISLAGLVDPEGNGFGFCQAL